MVDTPVPGPDAGPDRDGDADTRNRPQVPLRTRIIDWVQFVRSLAVNLIVIFCIVAIMVLLTRELLREPVIIEEVSLPPALIAKGYSGAVAAQRIWDAISDIQVKSGTHKIQTALIAADRQLNVSEPGTGISLQQLTQALRSMLKLPQTRIAGEVLCMTPDCAMSELHLRLRVFEGGRMHVLSSDPVGARSLDGYIHVSAMRVLEVIDPFVLAAYLYYYELRPRDAVDLAEDLLRRQHPQSAWAANLIGNHFMDQDLPAAALPHYRRALVLSEEFGPDEFPEPHTNIGLAMIELGDHESAIQHFWNAIEINDDNFEVWRALGRAQLAQGDPLAAAERLETAAQLAPDDILTWTVWGDALTAAERHQEAFKKYHTAIDIDPLDTKPRVAWRQALSEYIQAGRDRCTRAGRPVAEYLRVVGRGVPEDFRMELLAVRQSCGLPVPSDGEDS